MLDYDKAYDYAKEKHSQTRPRRDGQKYITHPKAVANILRDKGFDLEHRMVALFHDVIEDTDGTYEEILALSNKEVADAVDLLTKYPGYSMDEYIRKIKANPMALMVKLADRLHNLRCTAPLSNRDPDNKRFKEKYILETEKYYLDLAKGTIFELEIREALENVKISLYGNKNEELLSII